MASGSGGNMPKDKEIMKNILKLSNINDYEPNVLNQMLELTYRYVTSILEDALLYSTYVKKKAIDSEDVKLAICLQQGKNFTPVPSREVTAELARHKNKKPLSTVRSSAGPNLPSDRHSLSAANYNLVRFNQQKMVYKVPKSNPNGVLYSAPKPDAAQKTVSSTIIHSSSNSMVKPTNGENKRKLEDDE